MIDLEILKEAGLTQDNLKAWFDIDPWLIPHPTGERAPYLPYVKDMPARDSFLPLTNGQPPAQVDLDKADAMALRCRLIWRIRSRINEGRLRNFADFKTFHALDKAWDTPFRQISPTLIQEFMDSDPNDDRVYKAFQDWGMTHLIEERFDPKANKKVKAINLPVFFNIFVPLVQSYVKIRWARIMNDRMMTPHFSYDPVKLTTELLLKCSALTDRVQVMSSQYGYFDVQKQAVLKMLHYAFQIQFPRQSWHFEEQERRATKQDVALGKKLADGKTPAKEGDKICVRTREGITYHLPHPTRTYYDIAHPPYTINYDYGCEYYGYWNIRRYRDIRDNPDYWNRAKIALGTVDLIGTNPLFFQTVYSACTMSAIPTVVPPKAPDGAAAAAEFGVGVSSNDRERQIAHLYYGTEFGDQGILVTEHFEKLVPRDNGLGTYEYPIWFRFVVAGDCATILYAEPMAYAPGIYYGYDADESRTKNASLSMEVLPFQDHFSNMLSQILLTCKQNLANMAFVDEDQLLTGSDNNPTQAREVLDKIRNIGETLFRSLNIFSYSSKRAAKMMGMGRQGLVPPVVQKYDFPKGNVQEMTGVLKTILDILERILVMSSQEIAQAAPHELRVDEVRNIQASTSSRLQFTAAPVDIAAGAWKRQLYQGLMAYGDDDLWVLIPSDLPLNKETLELLGFTFTDHDAKVIKGGAHATDRYTRALIKKGSVAMNLWEFASTRSDMDRMDAAKVAVAMAQFVQAYMANPITAQAIGAQQAIELANYIARLAGLPRDFKLRDMSAGAQMNQQAAQQQLAAVVQQVLAEVKKEMEPLAAETDRNANEIAALFKVAQIPLQRTNLSPQDDTTEQNGNGNGEAAPPAGLVQPPRV